MAWGGRLGDYKILSGGASVRLDKGVKNMRRRCRKSDEFVFCALLAPICLQSRLEYVTAALMDGHFHGDNFAQPASDSLAASNQVNK